MDRFRIVVFTSMEPAAVRPFLRRLDADLPEVEVCGVLHEPPRGPLPLGRRLKRLKKYAGDPDFIRFAAHKAAPQAGRAGGRVPLPQSLFELELPPQSVLEFDN